MPSSTPSAPARFILTALSVVTIALGVGASVAEVWR